MYTCLILDLKKGELPITFITNKGEKIRMSVSGFFGNSTKNRIPHLKIIFFQRFQENVLQKIGNNYFRTKHVLLL